MIRDCNIEIAELLAERASEADTDRLREIDEKVAELRNRIVLIKENF